MPTSTSWSAHATLLGWRRVVAYWFMGLLGISRTPNQVERILALIPSTQTRWRWCTAEACGCMGCVNRSEWNFIQRYRLTREEHHWWRVVKEMQQEARELPGVRRRLLTVLTLRPVKRDILRMFPPL